MSPTLPHHTDLSHPADPPILTGGCVYGRLTRSRSTSARSVPSFSSRSPSLSLRTICSGGVGVAREPAENSSVAFGGADRGRGSVPVAEAGASDQLLAVSRRVRRQAAGRYSLMSPLRVPRTHRSAVTWDDAFTAGPGEPDVAWVGDITYIRTSEGWLYLASVHDLGSWPLLGYSMAAHMKHRARR